MTTTNFTIQAGEPWARRIRASLPTGRDYWLNTTDFEVESQVVALNGVTRTSLSGYMATSTEGDDIIIDWLMTGAQTRLLSTGNYDLIISDPGDTDARATVLLKGRITVLPVITEQEA